MKLYEIAENTELPLDSEKDVKNMLKNRIAKMRSWQILDISYRLKEAGYKKAGLYLYKEMGKMMRDRRSGVENKDVDDGVIRDEKMQQMKETALELMEQD